MKQIIKALTMTIVLTPSLGMCGGHPVHDPMSYAELVKMLQEAKKQTDQVIKVRNELMTMKDSIGYVKDDGISLKNELSNWLTYYDKIDNLDSETFSGFKWLGVDKLHPENYAYNTTEFARGKFNSEKAFDDVKKQIIDDEQHPEEMKYRRQELSHNSMASSVVVANKNKQELNNSKQNINKVVGKAVGSSNLLEAMKEQNKLLGIIASELVQQREIQSQQLELLASFFVNFQGTGKLSDPSKPSNVKKFWK